MRRLILSLVLVLLALPAQACPDPQGTQINQAYVDAFAKLAQKINTPCLVTFNEKNPLETLIEFRPDDEGADDWKTMLSVNLFYIGDDDMGARINEMTANFIKHVEDAGGKVIPQRTAQNDMGPMYLMRYHIGEGDTRENAVAILRAVGPDKIALIHWQRRGADFDPALITDFAGMNGIKDDPVVTKSIEKELKKLAKSKKAHKGKAAKTVNAKSEKIESAEIKNTPVPVAPVLPVTEPARPAANDFGVEVTPPASPADEKPKAKYNFKTKSKEQSP